MKAVSVTSTKKKDPFKDMYDELTDPLIIEEKGRQNNIKKHLNDKKEDTGLC